MLRHGSRRAFSLVRAGFPYSYLYVSRGRKGMRPHARGRAHARARAGRRVRRRGGVETSRRGLFAQVSGVAGVLRGVVAGFLGRWRA